MFSKPAKEVKFIEEDLENYFLSLPDNNSIKKGIKRAIVDLKENAFCGNKIERKLIPKEYKNKYGIDNLWWYPLPDAWRLVYTIAADKYGILAVIIEYFDHKNYARRFGYKT